MLSLEKIDSAVQEYLSSEMGAQVFVAKYVVIADVVLPNGARMLSRLPSDETAMWDIAGMIRLVGADIEEDFIAASTENSPEL